MAASSKSDQTELTSPPSTAPHADAHDVIRVRGSRVNNLKDVSVDIPKRRLTVFTGVSGSGKSSLVFGTIAAESQRLINETYSAFLQTFMPNTSRPDVDALENLSAAIIVDQERLTANARSTVGTVTDAYAMLRIVYSRLSTPHVGPPTAFSFNTASATGVGSIKVDKAGAKREKAEFSVTGGMCPACEGIGRVSSLDEGAIVDRTKTLNTGAILAPGFGVDTWYWKIYAQSGLFDPDKKLEDFSAEEWERFMHGDEVKVKLSGINMTFQGLSPRVRQLFIDKEQTSRQQHIRDFVERVASFAPCPECGGTRLSRGAREATVGGKTLPEVSSMQISDLVGWVRELDAPAIGPLKANLLDLLESLVEIGLGYLSLDRESGTLSGGEAQRTKMVRHLGSALSDMTYVFDEPTAGLHPHDITRMNGLLRRLRDKGNTVLVVEHKTDVIDTADHVIDIGPGAGSNGGSIEYAGDVAGLRSSGTLTGRHLDTRVALRSEFRSPTGALEIRDASTHNLQDVSVDVPLGVLTVVTGVAGSGKSSLIHGALPGDADVQVVDQSPIRGSRRSNPATYTGLLDPIRSAFAKVNGVKPALFSANSAGACPTCKGLGLVYTDLAMMASVAAVCEDCEGKRFTPEVLEYTLDGKNIAEVLDLSISEAQEFFTTKGPRAIIDRLVDVGLGYLRLGQPLNTLSGGERQRIKLAISMAGEATTYVLDEPTTGLHLADIDQLLGLLDGLVDAGHSVIVIEHSLPVMAHADWIIDLGPGAGHDGGTVVFEGTPADMVSAKPRDLTITGEHLKRYLGA